MDFAGQLAVRNEQIKAIKMQQAVRRAMAIEARAKIKPNSMRPSLRDMSLMRGSGDPLSLYYPGQ
jgi:hypothetical protein